MYIYFCSPAVHLHWWSQNKFDGVVIYALFLFDLLKNVTNIHFLSFCLFLFFLFWFYLYILFIFIYVAVYRLSFFLLYIITFMCWTFLHFFMLVINTFFHFVFLHFLPAKDVFSHYHFTVAFYFQCWLFYFGKLLCFCGNSATSILYIYCK